MIIGSRAQLVRQEVEGHRPERDDLRARGVGEPLSAPTRGYPIVRGVFRSRPEPPRRLFGAHLIVHQILLRKTQVGGGSVAEVSENLEKVQTSALRRAGPSGEGRGARGWWQERIATKKRWFTGSSRNFRKPATKRWLHPSYYQYELIWPSGAIRAIFFRILPALISDLVACRIGQAQCM